MIYIVTSAYSPADHVEKMFDHFYGTNEKCWDKHILADPGWPLGDSHQNSNTLMATAEKYGAKYIRIENQGCHENWNQIVRKYEMTENDLFFPVCPDTYVTKGWIKAAINVMHADPKCFTVQTNHFVNVCPPPNTQLLIGNEWVMQFNQLCAWSSGGFNLKHLLPIGGFGAKSKYYSYTEHHLVDKLCPKGLRWYLLRDYYDTVNRVPIPEYDQWKLASAGNPYGTPSFEEWLKQRGIR